MTAEANSPDERVSRRERKYRGGGSDAVYGFGLIGAWIYYLSHASTFWIGALGLLKGIVWPALLVYELLKYLKM